MPNVLIQPRFDGPDTGHGGIRRVVEAQIRYLPEFGYMPVDTIDKADIVSTHGVYHIDKAINMPVVHHNHGMYWVPEYQWPKWALQANEEVVEAIKSADISTAPSEWVARIMRRSMFEAPVLYHGIDPKDWKPREKQPFVLWNKTRVDPVCEIDTLNTLASMAPKVAFISTFGDLENRANIRVTGKLPFADAKKYVESSSVYLCNTRETFGIGTLEAMVCETPVLGWAWGGQREIIEHKVDGWLSVPGDFDDLLRGLEYCLENREKLGKAARAKVLKRFTWKRAIERYAALYDRAIKEYKAASGIKVSVVITCYNLAQYLPRAVESVLRQTLDPKKIEIIIVNDNSPDNTQEVAEKLAAEHADRTIRVIRNSENLYLAGALNVGIAAARGRYILPLDADNEIAENCLEVLSGELDKSGIDIAYGAIRFIQPERDFISEWPKDFDYVGQMSHKNQIPSTSMYRKSVWSRIGGYRRRCRTAEDADFWCRATSFGARAKKVTRAVTLIYHDRSDSMSHVEKDWAWHHWYAWNKESLPFVAPAATEIHTHEPAKVTVVIPVGPGHEEKVVDAVDSVLSQNYTRWDVVVVNDSGKRIPWIHPFIKVLDTGGNKGPAVARNMGVRSSNTPFWLPLDADDYLQPNALQALVGAWEVGHYIYSDWRIAETGEEKETPDPNCQELIRRLPHAVTALYERKMWEAVGGFDETIKAWEDWDFALALASKGFCGKRVPLPLLNYRMYSGGRREELYAKREELKAEIARKWHKYIVDGEPLMACGGCGQKRAQIPSSSTTPAVISGANLSSNGGSDLVLVEFLGTNAKVSYRGPATGNIYVFGNVESRRIRYVKTSDHAMYENRREFRVLDAQKLLPSTAGPMLEAVGPPKRD